MLNISNKIKNYDEISLRIHQDGYFFLIENKKCWQRHRKIIILLVGCKMVQPLCKIVKCFFKTLNLELPCDPAITLLGINQNKTKQNWKQGLEQICMQPLFTVAKMWKQAKSPSTEEWISKMWPIHPMEYHAALKRRHADIWYLEDIVLREVSQTQKTRYAIILLLWCP